MGLRQNVKLLDPLRPDLGLTDQYTRVLLNWLEHIHADMRTTLLMQYGATPPATLELLDRMGHDVWIRQGPKCFMAMDDEPLSGPASLTLSAHIEQLGGKWRDSIDTHAPKLAAWFAKKVGNRSDTRLQQILKGAGVTVVFDPTRASNDVMNSIIQQNVSLIRSIASEHLTEIEGLVMRSVAQGRNAADLAKELEARYKVSKRRAALIARDQNNKATAALHRIRQQQIGITKAAWLHSHAGAHPRPSHLAFDGKLYDVAKGAYLDGKWVWPGTEINCRCVSRAVLPALEGLKQ